MEYILYCAVQSKTLVLETLCSILSFFDKVKDRDSYGVLVITNLYDEFVTYKAKLTDEVWSRISFHNIDEYTVSVWAKGFFPRLKIKAIEWFLKIYNTDVLFVDSDTMFLKDVCNLFLNVAGGVRYLYETKYVSYYDSIFGTPKFAPCRPFVNQNNLILDNGRVRLEIPLDFVHYNSGAIGVRHSDLPLIKEIEKTCDAVNKYLIENKIGEETAFGINFQKYGKVMQAYTYLIHYCKAKIMRYMSAHYYGLLDNKARDLLKSELLKYKIDGKIFCQNNWTYDEIIFFYIFIRIQEFWIRDSRYYFYDQYKEIIINENQFLDIERYYEFEQKIRKMHLYTHEV